MRDLATSGACDPCSGEPDKGFFGCSACRAGIEVGRNICHGSDAVESAQHEIKLWFPEGLNVYTSCTKPWVTEF